MDASRPRRGLSRKEDPWKVEAAFPFFEGIQVSCASSLLNRGAGTLGCVYTSPGSLPEDHHFPYQVGLVTTEPASLFDRCPRDDL